MYPTEKIILCLAPCSIINNLQENTYKGYTPIKSYISISQEPGST